MFCTTSESLTLKKTLWRSPVVYHPCNITHKKVTEECDSLTINLQYVRDLLPESLDHYRNYKVWDKNINLVANSLNTKTLLTL